MRSLYKSHYEILFLLSDDIFSRFKRLPVFSKIIKSLPSDLLDSISNKRCSIEIFPKDYYHWNSIRSSHKNKLQIFSSNINIFDNSSISRYGPLKAFKCTCEFPVNFLDFIILFTKKHNYSFISDIDSFSYLSYYPFSLKSPLSSPLSPSSHFNSPRSSNFSSPRSFDLHSPLSPTVISNTPLHDIFSISSISSNNPPNNSFLNLSDSPSNNPPNNSFLNLSDSPSNLSHNMNCNPINNELNLSD